ncbi:helitron_like_N domain-containing protein [Trichonephila inaurata madagascariensis]|uniref:Helitron_like_N domain-containing protein n=1 Tax=Trichonephila inaurata madagascariensis TaxID=2747483 RepID=A0A8X6X2V2_9ARAC|nr:helitron_like_N domain-containing protein [Trichonephila inaurata madagascariensis]
MRKALLIADGRPKGDPNELDIYETQRLVEMYPVVVSRHFMIKVNALVTFMLNDDEVINKTVGLPAELEISVGA